MGFLADAGDLARYVTSLRSYVRRPLDFDDPRKGAEQRLAQRSACFLNLIRHGVYAHERSPYRLLLEHAGITIEDLEQVVADTGIDETLGRLYDEGVYITFEEFKARRPIRRGSLELHVTLADFDNPLVGGHVRGQTGGSGGTPRPLLLDIGMYEAALPAYALAMAAYNITNAPSAVWRPPPPSMGGTSAGLVMAKLGRGLDKFFVTQPLDARARLIAWGTALGIRLGGKRMPLPTLVPPEEAHQIGRWLARHCAAGTPPLISCTVSSAVRICESAARERLDIVGSVFGVGGEPVTHTKVEAVRAVGGRLTSSYNMSEVGTIGMSCPRPAAIDDCHVLLENVTLLQRSREVSPGATVNALFCTSMQPLMPKMMLNTETGDYAVLEQRDCGCALSEAGYRLHVHTIRSYEKLTTEGMTFVGDDLIRILEERLPARFGGGPTDYQFVEREAGARTEIALLVSPRVGEIDERALVELVLACLASGGRVQAMMAGVWSSANTLRVERTEPYVTGGSKVLPIHRLR